MKGTKKIGAMLILAAFLMGAGCKPQQESPGATTPAPEQPKPNPKPSTPVVVPSTVQFQGRFEDDTNKQAVKPYTITVTISNDRVGATVERIDTGFMYMGTNAYDAENKTVDLTLVNIQNANESFSLTGVYQDANGVFIINEFNEWTGKAVLPMVTRKDVEKQVKSYTLPVKLPQIGDSLLLIQVDGHKATVAIAAGSPTRPDDTEAMRTYKATGYVKRGTELFVRVPLDDDKDIDKADQVIEITGVLDPVFQRVNNLRASFLEHHNTDEDVSRGGHQGLTATHLPRFKTARLKFLDKSNNVYYLVLKAEPVVRRREADDTGSPKKYYKGEYYETYAMTAQFVSKDGTEKSREVTVYGKNKGEVIEYNKDGSLDKTKQPSYTFDFAAGMFVTSSANYALCNAIAGAARVLITDWKPLAKYTKQADGTYKKVDPANVGNDELVPAPTPLTARYKIGFDGYLTGTQVFVDTDGGAAAANLKGCQTAKKNANDNKSIEWDSNSTAGTNHHLIDAGFNAAGVPVNTAEKLFNDDIENFAFEQF